MVAKAEGAEQSGLPRTRSYKECEPLCGVKLISCLQFSILLSFLAPFRSRRAATLCWALLDPDGNSVVHDVDCSYRMKTVDLIEAIESGVDSSTCVFFQLAFSSKCVKEKHQCLLLTTASRMLRKLFCST